MDHALTTETTFFIAAQTSIILGLLHGLSPCEHSWPILAPFAVGTKNMKKVMRIGTVFCLGTATACIIMGATLGAMGSIIPASWSIYMGAATSAILIVLGVVLIVKPTFLHFHEDAEHGHSHHEHDEHEHHEHHDDHENADDDHHDHEHAPAPPKFKHGIYWGMFSIGFINMIVPCPTLAVMYSYALIAKSFWHGIIIFFVYAIATAIVLMFMAFLLVKASLLMKKFGQEKNEILISRITGVLIAGFGIYMVLIQFPAFHHIKLRWIL